MENLILTNKDKDFYSLMGKFLSRKEIVKELESNVWDEDGKIWFITKEKDNVINFSGIVDKGKHYLLDPVFTIKEERNKGLAIKNLNLLFDYCKNNEVKILQSVCTNVGEKLHKKLGFVTVSHRGKYSVMEKYF